MAPVTTGQIYWGAIPFVGLQIVMVALVLAFPQMVLVYRGAPPTVDPSQVEILLPPVTSPAPVSGDMGGTSNGGAPPGSTESQSVQPGQSPGDLTDLFK